MSESGYNWLSAKSRMCMLNQSTTGTRVHMEPPLGEARDGDDGLFLLEICFNTRFHMRSLTRWERHAVAEEEEEGGDEECAVQGHPDVFCLRNRILSGNRMGGGGIYTESYTHSSKNSLEPISALSFESPALAIWWWTYNSWKSAERIGSNRLTCLKSLCSCD